MNSNFEFTTPITESSNSNTQNTISSSYNGDLNNFVTPNFDENPTGFITPTNIESSSGPLYINGILVPTLNISLSSCDQCFQCSCKWSQCSNQVSVTSSQYSVVSDQDLPFENRQFNFFRVVKANLIDEFNREK